VFGDFLDRERRLAQTRIGVRYDFENRHGRKAVG
jgi:hypothetical protein